MSSRFPTSRLQHSGLSITKTPKLRKAKRLRGGGDVVVAEAVAVAEAVGAAEAAGAAEGVAADRLRLLTRRGGQNSDQPPQCIIEPRSTPRGLFSFAALLLTWRMSRSLNA
jgi:hypothetical protein